jgi:hypothetical protein
MKTTKKKTKAHPVSRTPKSSERRSIENRDLNTDEQRKITNAPIVGDDRQVHSDEEG